jgi:hypothetical protein
MNKPRIFLGSSGKQAELLHAITHGLEDFAAVEPWTVVFNPGVSTLERLVELTREVDFAAFLFAQDDWTTNGSPESAQASPRDNVVFEAGLFGGALGMRRTFIVHANGSKLPTDLLGLTAVRYDAAAADAEVASICQKIRNAIAAEGRTARIEGQWWQFSQTERTPDDPSALSILKVSRDRTGGLEMSGRAWNEDGRLTARYHTEAAREKTDPPGIFYYWKGERPLDPNAPGLEGTGEIRLESADRAVGYFTVRSETRPKVNVRTSGVYLRADPEHAAIMEGTDDQKRIELIAQQLTRWKAIRSS